MLGIHRDQITDSSGMQEGMADKKAQPTLVENPLNDDDQASMSNYSIISRNAVAGDSMEGDYADDERGLQSVECTPCQSPAMKPSSKLFHRPTTALDLHQHQQKEQSQHRNSHLEFEYDSWSEFMYSTDDTNSQTTAEKRQSADDSNSHTEDMSSNIASTNSRIGGRTVIILGRQQASVVRAKRKQNPTLNNDNDTVIPLRQSPSISNSSENESKKENESNNNWYHSWAKRVMPLSTNTLLVSVGLAVVGGLVKFYLKADSTAVTINSSNSVAGDLELFVPVPIKAAADA